MSTDPKVNYTLKIVSCESTVEEVSFEWSHNRISSTDSKVELQFKNSSIMHKEKTKEIFAFMSSLYLIKTRQNFTSNILEENHPKSKS